MKKIFSVLIFTSLLIGLTACKTVDSNFDNDSDTESTISYNINDNISSDVYPNTDSNITTDLSTEISSDILIDTLTDIDTSSESTDIDIDTGTDTNTNTDTDTNIDTNTDTTANSNITATNISTCKIFKKVVCCGDSYTAGYIADEKGRGYTVNEDFSWPHYMSTLTGNPWYNCGCSGCTVLTWQNHSRGLPAAKKLGKSQAYIIGLMINDASNTHHVELGSISDIGTTAQTYYGGMSAIIRELNQISPQAKIFVNTCPKEDDEIREYTKYNQAVRDIVEAYKDRYPVHCIDLAAYSDMYNNESLTNDYWHGHYTAIGYEQFSEIYAVILSNYINEHIEDFKDVAFIEYDK